jgi:hypothetical protein
MNNMTKGTGNIMFGHNGNTKLLDKPAIVSKLKNLEEKQFLPAVGQTPTAGQPEMWGGSDGPSPPYLGLAPIVTEGKL